MSSNNKAGSSLPPAAQRARLKEARERRQKEREKEEKREEAEIEEARRLEEEEERLKAEAEAERQRVEAYWCAIAERKRVKAERKSREEQQRKLLEMQRVRKAEEQRRKEVEVIDIDDKEVEEEPEDNGDRTQETSRDIYQCWIVWGRRTSVTIVPLLLAFAALGITLSQIRDKRCIPMVPDLINVNQRLYLAIDGLVMGLIILKIVMVYLEVRAVMAHSGRENKFRPIGFTLFILIESGCVIFATQLCSVIFYPGRDVNYEKFLAYSFFATILTQVPLNGIIPTIILVREALGMSYSDITPLSQTIESLHFAHNDDTSGNSNQEVEQLDAQACDAQDIVEVNRSSTA
ncbi:hypothetical protein BYT27DRAFT_7337853 [Phlegmacium glaucopus]|nr:hypothetical protein BYT27DRAFT_7337853 [Phlegmacium glaucopus]